MNSTLETKMAQLRNSDPWAQDANLDTRGLFSFAQGHAEAAEEKPDPFEQNDFMVGGTNPGALRRLIENPDEASIVEVARATGNPDLVAEAADIRAEKIAQQFRHARPKYLNTGDNFHALVSRLAGYEIDDAQSAALELMRSGAWTTEGLCDAYDGLLAQGLLETSGPRNLTEGERLKVARLAQSGATELAIEKYIRFALDDSRAAIHKVFTNPDPEIRSMCDQCIFDIWSANTPAFKPSADAVEFLKDFVGDRPLTIPLLNAGFADWRQHRNNSLIFGETGRSEPSQPSRADLDSLSDTEIEQLRRDTLRERARR